MKNYEIIRTNNSEFGILVIAKSFISPLEDLRTLSKDCGIESGSILVDLTVINGDAFNRYISADIKDGRILRDSIRTASIPEDLKAVSRDFFRKRSYILEASVVPNVDRII